jgi:hypothetical protein
MDTTKPYLDNIANELWDFEPSILDQVLNSEYAETCTPEEYEIAAGK